MRTAILAAALTAIAAPAFAESTVADQRAKLDALLAEDIRAERQATSARGGSVLADVVGGLNLRVINPDRVETPYGRTSIDGVRVFGGQGRAGR